MKSELTLIPKITIHPDKICSYSEIHWDPIKPPQKKMNLPVEYYTSNYERIRDSSRTANGLVSQHAKKKIKRALDYLLLMAAPTTGHIPKSGKKFQFRLGFITIDLPSTQIHSDNEIKEKCWNSFLLELTKYHGVKNYLWRAEKQKNGNIHFHLIIDKFILYNVLRKRWNRIVNKLGYVDRYRVNQIEFHKNGFRLRTELLNKWPADKQKKAYLEGVKCNWSSPNSTDVHSVRHISNLKLYVTKYLTKDPEQTQPEPDKNESTNLVKGRIWGCNTDLSGITGAQLDIDNEISAEITKLVKNTHCQKFEDTYFSVYYINIKELATHSPNILFKYFAGYLCEHFNYSSQLYLG